MSVVLYFVNLLSIIVSIKTGAVWYKTIFPCLISSFAIQFVIYVFPSPVLPVKNKFLVFISSNFFTKFILAFLMFIILSLGEMFILYFFSLISSENIFSLKLSKFSFCKLLRFDLLYEISINFCFKQVHIWVFWFSNLIKPVSLHFVHLYLGLRKSKVKFSFFNNLTCSSFNLFKSLLNLASNSFVISFNKILLVLFIDILLISSSISRSLGCLLYNSFFLFSKSTSAILRCCSYSTSILSKSLFGIDSPFFNQPFIMHLRFQMVYLHTKSLNYYILFVQNFLS